MSREERERVVVEQIRDVEACHRNASQSRFDLQGRPRVKQSQKERGPEWCGREKVSIVHHRHACQTSIRVTFGP